MAGKMAGVRFINREQVDSLSFYGYCAIVITEKDSKANHPDIGDFVDLLIGETSKDERIRVRLVADQKMPDGGVTSIYAAAAVSFKKDD